MVAQQVRTVGIPAADTEPCPPPPGKPPANGDLLKHDQDAMKTIKCDEGQLAKVRGEQGQLAPPATTAPPRAL